ncbi:S-methyl-5-thioribose-1-phosphate isomerase [Canibacter sp. lx-45]|uniref:S-methyl-5-thioribose-1-phosphate isomerase n=1 Tax=Canibacter zhuwentaonis TaxID=2837491 RepID=UPI001BDC6B41|nr:S-methyl-5-thioribose-1-phosphate isomerase [Canibacter zhuwentaonis]MBT1035666.1 S-methyl-5-thioribose-1-phosphate isomerase [Canibacter zhuwentaonis]
MTKAIEWISTPAGGFLRLIDQRALPATTAYLDITTVAQLIDAVKTLAVRGAPALGAAGAYGIAVAMLESKRDGWGEAQLRAAFEQLADARPTAVNLAWGAKQVAAQYSHGFEAVLTAAHKIARADEAANRKLSQLGADWLTSKLGKHKLRAITHCNTGALATTAWGTGYGILHELHTRGQLEMVYVDETRPLLQGTRLTSWELTQDGIPHLVQVDGAAASTILRGLVDFAIIGADRITANGDSANKIGSLALALACARAQIPFIVAAPYSTVDATTASGDLVEIENRDDAEVLELAGVKLAAPGVKAFNPAFDVTPHDLISAIVTERGVVEPAVTQQPLFAP